MTKSQQALISEIKSGVNVWSFQNDSRFVANPGTDKGRVIRTATGRAVIASGLVIKIAHHNQHGRLIGYKLEAK